MIEGLRAGEFAVAFQPIVHAQTRVLNAVECLLRWQHPEYGLLLPGAFEPALHDPAVAHEAARFVLDVACRGLRNKPHAVDAPPLVAINIQASQLLDDRLAALVAEVTGRYGVPASSFELEIVENEETLCLVATREFTAPLRAMGVRLALDDFGTGYSSLAALAGAHVDTVKLAREFLRHGSLRADSRTDSCIDSRTASVLRSVIEMVDRLGMRTVVEGVESDEQMAWLAALPTVYAQGYALGKPQYDFPPSTRKHG
jgi:EAL domain-containing protein (putative c-di-GMP-specific phosphodiesterase class I)